eukprot:TRINITY_DN7119_c0_g1_i1.p1 TRINITY_DN7119_c0_g1~~TRINITY_DN7119_c0_g1_i1.p1  ORF type:complete len:297 (+),score=37.58 TRINITY_DN7119_c0_g1_i1:70-960(+)
MMPFSSPWPKIQWNLSSSIKSGWQNPLKPRLNESTLANMIERTRKERTNLLGLPQEIIRQWIDYLPFQSCASLARTCRAFYVIVRVDRINDILGRPDEFKDLIWTNQDIEVTMVWQPWIEPGFLEKEGWIIGLLNSTHMWRWDHELELRIARVLPSYTDCCIPKVQVWGRNLHPFMASSILQRCDIMQHVGIFRSIGPHIQRLCGELRRIETIEEFQMQLNQYWMQWHAKSNQRVSRFPNAIQVLKKLCQVLKTDSMALFKSQVESHGCSFLIVGRRSVNCIEIMLHGPEVACSIL